MMMTEGVSPTRNKVSALLPSRLRTYSIAVFLVAASLLWLISAAAQSGFDDDRVMLQGFYWESYRHGQLPTFGTKRWYEIARDLAPRIRDARFDLVWLPPPSYAGDLSAGYNPKEYFRLDNSYGTFDHHRAMI